MKTMKINWTVEKFPLYGIIITRLTSLYCTNTSHPTRINVVIIIDPVAATLCVHVWLHPLPLLTIRLIIVIDSMVVRLVILCYSDWCMCIARVILLYYISWLHHI